MRFRGQLLDKATARTAQRAIQIMFQDPFGALDPRMPVSAIIAEPLLIQRIGNGAERAPAPPIWSTRSACRATP